MNLRLDLLINRRCLQAVTAAAMLTAYSGTQANEVPGYARGRRLCDKGHLIDVVKEALGLKELRVVETGGNTCA